MSYIFTLVTIVELIFFSVILNGVMDHLEYLNSLNDIGFNNFVILERKYQLCITPGKKETEASYHDILPQENLNAQPLPWEAISE